MIRWTYVCLAVACATGANAQTGADARPQTVVPAAKAETPPAMVRRASKEPPQKLLLTVSLFAGDADDANSSTGASRSGVHADADAMLTYERRVGRAVISANGRSVIRQNASAALTPMGQEGNVDFSFSSGRQQFHASQSVRYSPSHFEFGGPQERDDTPLGEAAASHGDFATGDLSVVTSTTALGWSRAISQRATLSAAFDRRQSVFGRSTLDMTVAERRCASDAAADPLHVAPDGAHVSLRRHRVRADGGRPLTHDIDLGVDYARPLSLSRRTKLSFGSGSAVTPHNGGVAFNLTGNAMLTRQIGRTWQARVGVTRDVQLLEGFAEPVVANALAANVGGALRHRLMLSSSFTASRGAVGVGPATGNGYLNWTGAVGIAMPLGRRASFDVQASLRASASTAIGRWPPGWPTRAGSEKRWAPGGPWPRAASAALKG